MTSSTRPARIGIGMIGYAFMGAAHSQAWRTAHRVFDVPLEPDMVALCGRDRDKTEAAAGKLGWRVAESQWRRVIDRDDVDVIDICTPGDTHAEIAIAALEAGKHVLCEKPLANSVEEAVAMTEAADRAQAAGVRSMVAFNYRRVPALALARKLVADGRLGTIRHVRAQYLQDWILDPEFPLVWRLDREKAGSGALGDIGAHIIDLAQFLTGSRITGVSGLTETFITERPLVGSASGERGTVTVDDAALFHARFDSGAIGSFEATRLAGGRKNSMRIELNGSLGSLAFDFESMNELSFHDHTDDPATAGFRRILVTEPTHPYLSAWWPPGHALGYEHSFTHEVYDFLTAIAGGHDPEPSFADGLQVQRVLAAVETSAAANSVWTAIGEPR
ncbi:MAG: gfo/Idh/MocA family oxidoreductase [Amycolatopsis sp.]|jgi:predicted dehydrogenase|uniref:Gfo/Idh/MocA family protein n=1 Tax=Amycolatopsis sp. TaxID=37632 RepID=UPI002605ED25|nr:Gfo/Idh/MocA family oxidoreductase [Amycolatopsis sp.]MCU1687699.1 gfo/Idh/MocA family oxidoreductase [Amycolatopsis sp.]